MPQPLNRVTEGNTLRKLATLDTISSTKHGNKTMFADRSARCGLCHSEEVRK